MRPFVVPVPWVDAAAALGFPPDHPYVRRYWTAVLGWGAVADLLRLVTAASRAEPLRRPIHLPQLIREGLVLATAGETRVRMTIPPLSAAHVRRLPPGLRREHARLRFDDAHRPSP